MPKYDLQTTLGQMREFAAAVVDEAALGRARYETDRYGRAWIDYHLLLLGEATNRIRAELDALDPGTPWGDVVGPRNVIIHGYDRVKRDRVWVTAVEDVPGLLRTIEALLATAQG